MAKDDRDEKLKALQLALVKWQTRAMKNGEKVLIIFEGRDAAGKDGAIRVLTEHLSVRNTRVVALPKPSDRRRSQWYFQRYVPWLPAAGETVIFNRSWYNRGGVEPVMGFCTPKEHETFLRDVPVFESMLLESELRLVKLWLDVGKDEQAKRLQERHDDPLKALKSSPLDAAAQEKWDDYTRARDEMLARTSTAQAPWICVDSDHKGRARRAILAHLAHELDPDCAPGVDRPDPAVLFEFEVAALSDGRLHR
jgi:polyphosphate kinase 2